MDCFGCYQVCRVITRSSNRTSSYVRKTANDSFIIIDIQYTVPLKAAVFNSQSVRENNPATDMDAFEVCWEILDQVPSHILSSAGRPSAQLMCYLLCRTPSPF
jgi:hypothetical protein